MIKNPKYYKSPHAIAGVDVKAPVLVALSGGADSVSLLHNVVEDSKLAGFPVFAAHVNHNIRLEEYGCEAKRDEEFCRELCHRLGVELFFESIDVPALAKSSGESVETAARRARYGFFSKVMNENGISLLLTAHNATDNFETQLFNLCRGTGVSGMAGIPECRAFDKGKFVVRPILAATKTEILQFCAENSIAYVTDSTNFEVDATRNKIRNLIFPELEKIFPSAQRAASRLAASAAQTEDYMKSEAQKYLDGGASVTDKEISFECRGFNELHIALRCEIILAVGEVLGISLETVHIRSAINLVGRADAHSKINLPSGFILEIEDGCACFSKEREKNSAPEYELPLTGGILEIPQTDFCVVAGEENLSEIDGRIYSLYTSAILKSDKIKDGLLSGGLCVRSRREGDRIVDGGNTKKLKKLMCDKKIPIGLRSSLPLICFGGEIVYAPACAVCDDAKKIGESETQIFIYKK